MKKSFDFTAEALAALAQADAARALAASARASVATAAAEKSNDFFISNLRKKPHDTVH